MEQNLSDEQILRDYYKKIYECELLKQVNEKDEIHSRISEESMSNHKMYVFFCMLFVASIYVSIFFIMRYAILPIAALIPASLFLLIYQKSEYKQISEKSSKTYDDYFNCLTEYKEYVRKTPKPPIPDDKLNQTSIKEILDVFASKRADTFKEALIIYEQDLQHRELVNKQRAMQQQIYSAQMAAAQAQKEAENAKQEAEYLRREEDYYRDQIYHLQQEDYWNNN
ncbi:MAG: hypothetical protein IKR45_00430 [Treponema sp.]|nr:hypothetical protein [Treponema sp.]